MKASVLDRMSGGVTFLAFVNGHQPYLSHLDAPQSVVANVYVNQNVLVTIPGSRATYADITQDVLDGIGYHYVRRFKGEFERETAHFFASATPRYAPPTIHTLLGRPTSFTSDEYLCWSQLPRDGGSSYLFSSEVMEYYLRALEISRNTAPASALVTLVPNHFLSRLLIFLLLHRLGTVKYSNHPCRTSKQRKPAFRNCSRMLWGSRKGMRSTAVIQRMKSRGFEPSLEMRRNAIW